MQTEQVMWRAGQPRQPGGLGPSAQLVLVFGGTEVLGQPDLIGQVRDAYPGAHILGCSTAGEIFGTRRTADRTGLSRRSAGAGLGAPEHLTAGFSGRSRSAP